MEGLQDDAGGMDQQKEYGSRAGHVLAMLGKILKALVDEILSALRPGGAEVKDGNWTFRPPRDPGSNGERMYRLGVFPS